MIPNHCRIPLLLLASLTCVHALPAHGGQYLGPSSVAPPGSGASSGGNSGSSSSGSGGSGSSSSGASGGSTNPTAATPSAGSGPSATLGARGNARARGVALDDDLGRWEFWWEFGKDPWLRLRDAIYDERRTPLDDAMLRQGPLASMVAVQRPNDADLAAATDALTTALRSAHDRDTISSCIVALAKIGRDSKNADLHALFAPWLRSGDQELRETAALAYGIAGQAKPEHLDLLAALVADDAEGRRLSGGSAVNERTRAFAVYAQGLLLARHANGAAGLRIVTQLVALLGSPETCGRDLKVAAIEALGQFPPLADSPAAKVLRQTVLDALERYYQKELGPGERLLQAHVPPALARLVPPSAEALRLRYRDLLLADLRSGLGNSSPADARGGNLFIAQSCALALGALALPWHEPTDPDAEVGATLLQAYRDHRDQQTRAFALVGLARQGGPAAKAALLRELDRANRAIEMPWCAMALGVLHARAQQAAATTGGDVEPDADVTTALRRALQSARNPSSQGALAIAMGLCGDRDGADQLRDLMAASRQRDDVAGHVALALGLLRDRLAVADVRDLLRGAERRPILILQCVRALGLLGDLAVADELCKSLQDPDPSLMRLSAIAAALGQIGDRRCLEPLQAMLANDKLTPLTRAFAAVALGRVCDKDPLPWNSTYSTNTNYRASTETLTNGHSGILDIL
jgi:hypothetical protein